MKAVIFSGIAVLAGIGGYTGIRIAKAVDERIAERPAHAERTPNYAAAQQHLDNAVYALTPIEASGTSYFYGFELDNCRNARPAAARSELERVLEDLPPSTVRELIQRVYNRLPDTPVSSSTFEQECKQLDAAKHALSHP
jgi:hypothetical protein